MKSNYDLSQWERETEIGRRLFVYNFGITGSEFAGWKLVKTVLMPHEPGVEEKIYMWERKKNGAGERVRISVIESAYWRHTQQHLLNQLNHCMRSDMPRGKGKTSSIGDIQYIGQTQKASDITSVFFTRGNLRISVNSVGKKSVDVISISKKLDGRLIKPPTKSEEKRGLVITQKPKTIKVKKTVKAALIDGLPAPTPSAGMTRVMIDDGELRRDGNVLYCISEKDGSKSAEILNFKLE